MQSDTYPIEPALQNGRFVALFIRAVRETLPERTADILIARYGLLDGRSQTLARVGEQYGISRERIRQLVNKGLGRLQRRAATEARRGDKEASCAKLTAYVRDAVIPGQTGEHERLLALLVTDLPHLKPASEAAPLVASFLGLRKEADRFVLMIKNLTDDQTADQHQADKDKREQERLDTVLQDVIWPPEIRLVQEDGFGRYSAARAVSLGVSSEVGAFYSDRMNRMVEFESTIERDFLRRLDTVSTIAFYQEQPFCIAYDNNGKTHHYYPDVFFVLDDGHAIVVEIAPSFEMAQQVNWAKWGELRSFCQERGYGFLITDGRLTFQSIMRHPVRPGVREALLATLNGGPMDWPAYRAWRKEWGIRTAELYAIVINKRLVWRPRPFFLGLG